MRTSDLKWIRLGLSCPRAVVEVIFVAAIDVVVIVKAVQHTIKVLKRLK